MKRATRPQTYDLSSLKRMSLIAVTLDEAGLVKAKWQICSDCRFSITNGVGEREYSSGCGFL